MRKRSASSIAWRTTVRLLIDALRFVSLGLRSRSQLAAENLFLRKQLALYQERRVKPRRADDATRITLLVLSRLSDWRAILTIVKPDTLIRWHRKGFRLFWRWKSRVPGRPPVPVGSPAVNRRHGSCQCDVGRGADCRGTAAQTRSPRVGAYSEALHVTGRATAGSTAVPAVEHIRAQSCGRHARLRLLRDHHGEVSHAVCVCRS